MGSENELKSRIESLEEHRHFGTEDRIEKLELLFTKLGEETISPMLEEMKESIDKQEKLEQLLNETIGRVGKNSDGCRKDLGRINNLERMLNEDDFNEWKDAINENIVRAKKLEAVVKQHQCDLHGTYDIEHNYQFDASIAYRLHQIEDKLEQHLDHFHGDRHYKHHKEIVDILKQLLTRMEYVCRKYPSPYDAFDKKLSAYFYLKLKQQLDKSASGFCVIDIKEESTTEEDDIKYDEDGNPYREYKLKRRSCPFCDDSH